MIGNKLRKLYIVPAYLANANAQQYGNSLLTNFQNVSIYLDSNLLTQYDNTKYENLLNCRLSNKFWHNILQSNNIFLPLYFCSDDNNTADRIARNELYVDIFVAPMKDIEFIYIPIRLRNPGDVQRGGK